MERKQKIELLKGIEAGKASFNDLSPVYVIIELPDGTFTCNGQPVKIKPATNIHKPSGKIMYDLSGVSTDTLRRLLKDIERGKMSE